jgi:hypothetical protein
VLGLFVLLLGHGLNPLAESTELLPNEGGVDLEVTLNQSQVLLENVDLCLHVQEDVLQLDQELVVLA